MAPRPIAAETEPTPDQILAEVAGYSGRTVDRVRLRGVKAHDGDDVKAAMHHQDASFWPWSKGSVFMPREFVYDVRRVVLFYEESGFPDARVRGRAVPENDDEVDLELTVNEGQPTLVTGIEVLDWPFTKPSVADLIKDLPQEVGKPCDRSEVEKSREAIRQRLVEKSHWQAVVHDTILVAGYRARVQFRVEPGLAYQMRKVVLADSARKNLGDLPHRLVVDEFRFDAGDPYDPKEIDDYRGNLIDLDLFQRIDIKLEAAGGDTLDLRVDVARLERYSPAIGVGYGSEEKFRVRAQWLDRDFLGGGRRLLLQGAYSSLEYGANASLTQPRIFHGRFDLIGRLFAGQETEPNYDLTKFGGGMGVRRPLWRWMHMGLDLDHEENELTVIVPDESIPEEGPSELTELKLGLVWDSSDDRLRPTRGTHVLASLAGTTDRFVSDYTYGIGDVSAAHYITPGARSVLALYTRAGVALPAARTNEIPIWRRLYAGGATTMRSYGRKTLGPLDDEGNGLGGEVAFEFTAELRRPIMRPFGIALFAEAGQVWEKVADAGGDLDVGAGVGLRLQTPVGPIRVDVGFKVTDYDPQLDPIVGHFSIGEAF
jgi:outer membrane protein assembly factor BamA